MGLRKKGREGLNMEKVGMGKASRDKSGEEPVG